MKNEMAKNIRLSLCFVGILIVSLLAVTLVAAPAYAEETTDNTAAAYAGGKYTSFGDSIAAGYNKTTNSYVKGFSVVDGSYPALVSSALGMTEIPYSAVAFRSNEILRILGGSVSDDYYYQKWSSLWDTLSIPSATNINKNVKNSKLVTVNIGSNDVTSYPTQVAGYNVLVAKGLYDEYSDQFADIVTNGNSSEQLRGMLDLMGNIGCYAVYVEELTRQMVIGVVSFKSNFNNIMDIVCNENTKGTVMVVGMYNPYRNAKLTGGGEGRIGALMGTIVTLMNSHMKRKAEVYGYVYCDVTSVESFASKLGSVSIVEAYNDDAHPTARGHVQIAKRIIEECAPGAGPQDFEEDTNPGILLEDDSVRISSASDPNEVIDIKDGSKKAGANAITWTANNFPWQQFTVSTDSEGFTTIKSKNSGMYLGVSSEDEPFYSTNVCQVEDDGENRIQWVVEQGSTEGTYYFRLRGTQLYLDVQGGTAANDTNLQLWTSDASNSRLGQEFSLNHVVLAEGYYIIRSADDQNYVIDIVNNSKKNGANVTLWEYTGAKNQKFQIYQMANGYYKIAATSSWKALNVAGGKKKNGTNVNQWAQSTSNHESWIVEKNDDGTYSFKSVCSGLYLDVDGGKAGNGVNIQTWEKSDDNDGLGQRFVLEATSI